jgi:glycolate oxidase FAD binding subunit
VQSALLDKLRALAGQDSIITGVELSRYAIDGRVPECAVFPRSVEDVVAVVQQAAGAGIPVIPWGGGTAAGVGASPAVAGIVLGLARLARLVEHEPGDLTATVQAGMTMAALQEALRARGQWLSLDPPEPDRATVGGVIAANAWGPRRHLYGTARDVLIGLTVVTAAGEVVRGGAKVVKNVAGYDIPKLFVGSHGTLGVIVEATLKLRPLPDDERLLAVCFARLAEAGAAAQALLASDLVPCVVDLLDGAAAAALRGAAAPTLVVGFDGSREQVEWQAAELGRLLGPLGGGAPAPLDGRIWPRLSSAARDAGTPVAVMTLSVLPTGVAGTMEEGRRCAEAQGFRSAWSAHAGVGAVIAALYSDREALDPGPVTAVLRQWRAAAHAGAGHATLIRAPVAVKADVAVWDEPGVAGRIMQRIKAQLDPQNILNPGRFVGGI